MSKDMKKNDKIIIISLIVIIILLIGVIIKQNQDIKEAVGIEAKQTTEKNTVKVMSQEEFSQYITEIPITTENWKNYFEYEYKKVENKDAFGEIKSTSYEPHLKLKDNMYGYVVLQIEINSDLYSNYEYKRDLIINSNDTILPMADFRLKSGATITMNDIICTKTKGNLYTLNLPEDIWQIDETNGKRYFNVGTEYDCITYWEDTYISQLCQKEYAKETNNN